MKSKELIDFHPVSCDKRVIRTLILACLRLLSLGIRDGVDITSLEHAN